MLARVACLVPVVVQGRRSRSTLRSAKQVRPGCLENRGGRLAREALAARHGEGAMLGTTARPGRPS